MMDKYLDKLFPPGYDREKELRQLVVSFGVAVLYSFQFFFDYYEAYKDLFWYDGIRIKETGLWEKTVRPGEVIVPFKDLIGYSFLFFVVFVIILFVVAGQHYWYYLKGSKSIYLARRIPERFYMLKTTLGLTILGLVLTFLMVGMLLGIFYLVYVFVTPAGCLPWQSV